MSFVSASLTTAPLQQQTLTPQQQYALKLLHMNASELLAEAERAAEENPLIECEELERSSADTQPTACMRRRKPFGTKAKALLQKITAHLKIHTPAGQARGRVILTKRPLLNGLQLNARCGKIYSKNWGLFQTTLKFTRSSAVSLKSLTTLAF